MLHTRFSTGSSSLNYGIFLKILQLTLFACRARKIENGHFSSVVAVTRSNLISSGVKNHILFVCLC